MLRIKKNENILELCKKNDQVAWQILTKDIIKIAIIIAKKYGFDYHLAQDIAQKVCVKMAENINEVKENKALFMYIKKMTYHICVSESRIVNKNAQTKNINDIHDPLDESLSEPGNKIDEELSPTYHRRLKKAVQKLSYPYNYLIAYRFYGELKYAEIAKKMDLDINQIGTLIGRGVDKLDKYLTSEERDVYDFFKYDPAKK